MESCQVRRRGIRRSCGSGRCGWWRSAGTSIPRKWATIESVAAKLGIGTAQTLHAWVRRDQIDSGRRAGVTSDMAAEVRKLRAENKELKRANEILKSASVFFAASLDR
jgi:transposase